jgi:hypothetical protein
MGQEKPAKILPADLERRFSPDTRITVWRLAEDAWPGPLTDIHLSLASRDMTRAHGPDAVCAGDAPWQQSHVGGSEHRHSTASTPRRRRAVVSAQPDHFRRPRTSPTRLIGEELP